MERGRIVRSPCIGYSLWSAFKIKNTAKQKSMEDNWGWGGKHMAALSMDEFKEDWLKTKRLGNNFLKSPIHNWQKSGCLQRWKPWKLSCHRDSTKKEATKRDNKTMEVKKESRSPQHCKEGERFVFILCTF